jgi:hypothetical protein
VEAISSLYTISKRLLFECSNIGLVRTKTLNSWLCLLIHHSLGTPFQRHCLDLCSDEYGKVMILNGGKVENDRGLLESSYP